MKLYLAGPMTGLPQFNFPLFDAVAAALRAQGHEVTNPTEMDSPEWRAAAMASPDGDVAKAVALTHQSWGDLLARDVKLVADGIEGVVLLPGWQHSRGAKLEAFTAVLCRKTLFFWDSATQQATWVSPFFVMSVIHQFTIDGLLE